MTEYLNIRTLDEVKSTRDAIKKIDRLVLVTDVRFLVQTHDASDKIALKELRTWGLSHDLADRDTVHSLAAVYVDKILRLVTDLAFAHEVKYLLDYSEQTNLSDLEIARHAVGEMARILAEEKNDEND